MNNLYTSAVIGLGRIGALYPSSSVPRNHTAAYLANKNIEMIAGIDPSLEAQFEFKKIWGDSIQLFSSVKEMVNKGIHPDIVSICTTPNVLQDNLKSFTVFSPKIYFLEKPAMSSEDQCAQLLSLLSEIPTAINYHRCWDPRHKIFFKKIKTKKIFAVRTLYSKGTLNYASHIIALLIQNFGEVSSVNKIPSNKKSDGINDTSESFSLNFTQGFSAIFQGVDELDYDLLEVDFITNDGLHSLKSGGCRQRYEKPINNLFYQDYSSLSDSLIDNTDGQIEGLPQAIQNIVDFLDKKTDKLECDLQCGINVFKILNEIKNMDSQT